MFLHIVALDKQFSVHADEKKPLSDAIKQAFSYHKKKHSPSHQVTTEAGKKLDPKSSPKALKLKENDMVYVRERSDD